MGLPDTEYGARAMLRLQQEAEARLRQVATAGALQQVEPPTATVTSSDQQAACTVKANSGKRERQSTEARVKDMYHIAASTDRR